MVHASTENSSVPPREGGWTLMHDDDPSDPIPGEGSLRGSDEEIDPFLRASHPDPMFHHPSALNIPAPVLDATRNSMDSTSTGASGYGIVVEPSQARFGHLVPPPVTQWGNILPPAVLTQVVDEPRRHDDIMEEDEEQSLLEPPPHLDPDYLGTSRASPRPSIRSLRTSKSEHSLPAPDTPASFDEPPQLMTAQRIRVDERAEAREVPSPTTGSPGPLGRLSRRSRQSIPERQESRPTTPNPTSPPTSQSGSTEQDGSGTTQPPDSSQQTSQHPTQSENNPHRSDEQGDQSNRHSPDKSNASKEDVGGPRVDGNNSRAPLPTLPQAPANFFSREEIANDVLDLTDQVASVALFGPIGVGKSFVALTLLHHNRTQAKFGRNRHFMRCDNLTNSLEGFLERLSDAILINRTTNVAQLRSHLESCPPLILLLDGVDLILDPLAPEAKEISATIEEFGSCENVCLVTTSRMYPDIHGFHRVEIPTLSEDGARDTFYSLCDLERSSAMDDLIARLDFHPLSINLFASFVRENNWDESMLLRAWDDDQTSLLKTSYYRTLEDAVESSLRSPTIRGLGNVARDVLEAIAISPCGVKESTLDSMFSEIAGIGGVIAVLCKFSLLYREDGFVKMPSPFRFYFTESIQNVGSTTGSDTAHDQSTDGDTPSFPCYPALARPFVLLYLFVILV